MARIATIVLLFFVVSCGKQTQSPTNSRSWTDVDRKFLLDNLNQSLSDVFEEVDSLTEEQWNYLPDDRSWSVAMVVEHLITHDELFSREVRVLSQLPGMIPQPDSLFASDDEILSYREITPQNTGKAPGYLEPLGRWRSKSDAMAAYDRTRMALIEYVDNSQADFRKFYTTSGRGPTKYRDLHQLLLISVAHTQRHTQQIRNIKLDAGF